MRLRRIRQRPEPLGPGLSIDEHSLTTWDGWCRHEASLGEDYRRAVEASRNAARLARWLRQDGPARRALAELGERT